MERERRRARRATRAPEPDLPDDWRQALTPPEREWLEGFEGAASDEELAARWGVHVATVSRPRSRLRRRLGDVL